MRKGYGRLVEFRSALADAGGFGLQLLVVRLFQLAMLTHAEFRRGDRVEEGRSEKHEEHGDRSAPIEDEEADFRALRFRHLLVPFRRQISERRLEEKVADEEQGKAD